jgi:hypothetical protein
MALQNDPRMFTGGAVVFNSNPTVQFQAQQLAKKQAKEEALNKYFDDQLKSLNTEGIRPQDLVDPEKKGRGIVDRINTWRQKWMENKDQILKGGQPKMQSDMELQDIRRQIAEAKAAGTFVNELGKARAKGDYNPDEDELHLLDKVTKPIYDPESKKADGTPYGWTDVAPVVPEFDAKKQNEYWLASTKGLQPGKQYDYDKLTVNAKTGQAIVPFKEAYSPGQVKAIAEQAGEIAMNDKSVKKHFNKILDSPTSEEWEKLNKAYQSVFGTDKIVSTPEQAAQADAIIRASVPTKEGQEQEINYAQRLYDKKMMTAFNSALIASRGGGKEQGKTWDLSEYPTTSEGGKDLTVPFQGYVVTAIGNDKLLAKNVVYYPDKKEFKVTEYVGRDASGNPTGEKVSRIRASTFRQNIKGNNPQADMKEFDALINTPYSEGAKPGTSNWRDRAKPVKK